jgi:TolB-like protein/DNA-binding winged helix-turn-helix (wHTH) protein
MTKCFQFAGHTLDVARSSLRGADGEVQLRPKSFEVLVYLVENADRLVPKDELMRAIWPNVVVTDESLTHCVSELRSALGDSQQTIIKTVPRRGYRFAAPVSRLAADLASMAPSVATAALQPPTLPDIGRKLEPALPDRPSIAVLPFQNMSGDPEQEYFADGVVEDIITALSRFSSLFVIARNSSFTYKGRAVDVKQVGRELGVRYVLEGSVRKAWDRMRITAQLIDAANGAHLWADRFDGALEAVFDLQDRVTEGVVTAIAPKLEQVEIVRARRKPTESLDAYDYFLRGTESLHLNTQESTAEALRLFSRAIELDTNFAAAHGMAAFCYVARKASRWVTDRAQDIAEANRLARRALQLASDDAIALARGGHTLAYVVEDFDAGRLFIDRALALNPNLAPAWFASGWLRVWIGEHETAIKHTARLMRMSPLDPFLAWMHSATAFAHVFTGRYELGVAHAELALSEKPNLHQALRAAAVSNALAGRPEQARKAIARLRQIDPTLAFPT